MTRCRVHFMRNVLSQVPRKQQGMVSAIVRTVFAAPDQKTAKNQLYTVVEQLREDFRKQWKFWKMDVRMCCSIWSFRENIGAQLHSTNPLERLNREIRRRTDVVSIYFKS